MIISSEKELISFGQKVGRKLHQKLAQDAAPVAIELIGDVGAGKTTLTRGIADGLGVKEPVTSPSFTISKRYAFSVDTPNSGELIHYDFYRLEDPGLMVEDFTESIASPNTVVVIEWGESVKNLLPAEHLSFQIFLNDDGTRTIKELSR